MVFRLIYSSVCMSFPAIVQNLYPSNHFKISLTFFYFQTSSSVSQHLKSTLNLRFSSNLHLRRYVGEILTAYLKCLCLNLHYSIFQTSQTRLLPPMELIIRLEIFMKWPNNLIEIDSVQVLTFPKTGSRFRTRINVSFTSLKFE